MPRQEKGEEFACRLPCLGGMNVLSLFDVETEEQLLVTQVESSVRDDGMRPNFSAWATLLGLGIQLEATMLFPAFRRGFDQGDRAIALRLAVESSVGIGNGSLAQGSLFIPLDLAGLEVLANPTVPVGVAVQMVAQLDHAAMVVLHVLVVVHVHVVVGVLILTLHISFAVLAGGS